MKIELNGRSAFRVSLLAIAILASLANPASADTGVCASSSFDSVMGLAALATISTAAVIVLCYMFGEFFQNARMLTWAKSEVLQVFMSLVIVVVILGLSGTFCNLQIGDVGSTFTGLPAIYANFANANMCNASSIYLENMMAISDSNLRSLRYSLGSYEIRTTFRSMNCNAECWVALVSFDTSDYSGESALIAVTNNLLSTATVSYFTSVFQYFTLQYIYQGLFLSFLPLAIVIRSMPFMRQLGGGLVAIFVSLFILYPLLLVMDSAITPGLAAAQTNIYIKGCTGADVFRYESTPALNAKVQCKEADSGGHYYDEQDLHGFVSANPFATADVPDPPPMVEQARASALIFIATVFLGALDWVVIVVLARGVARLLGEEVDLSRLGQMV